MREVHLNGQDYRIEKLNAFQQFHVSRKIAPLIPPLVPAFTSLAQVAEGSALDADAMVKILEPLASELASMPDADAEYVMATALSVVRRKQDKNNFAPVWSDSAKSLMFDDMDLSIAMQLVYHVVVDSLGPFIQGLLSNMGSSPEESEQTG